MPRSKELVYKDDKHKKNDTVKGKPAFELGIIKGIFFGLAVLEYGKLQHT